MARLDLLFWWHSWENCERSGFGSHNFEVMLIRITQSFWSSLIHYETRRIVASHLHLRAPVYILRAALLPFLLSAASSFAGSATWNLNPTSDDWNIAANWTPATVPNGPNDTATFDKSNVTRPSISAATVVDGIVFAPAAPAFTLTVNPSEGLTISGAGVTNSSGNAQTFVADAILNGSVGIIDFTGNATAGDGNTYAVNGLMTFDDNATAGSSTFIESSFSFSGGFLFFSGSADHGNFILNTGTTSFPFAPEMTIYPNANGADATFTLKGPLDPGVHGPGLFFSGSAGNATINLNGGVRTDEASCTLIFNGSGSSGNATITAHGGISGGMGALIRFFDAAGSNDTSRIELLGNSILDITIQNLRTGVQVGSIEGTGVVFLGDRTLTVGSNRLSTTFSGIIDGIGGSLTKIGPSTLALSGPNTYTGATTVNGGKLVVSNESGSGTGTGPVQVNRGTLRGTGTIAGSVTLGTGTGSGAVLSPGQGRARPRTLNIQSTLTFNSDATYGFGLNSRTGIADKVVANGVTIIGGAIFSFAEFGNTVLSPGTVFTVIDNTAGTPISGVFSNLADGSTLIGSSNTYLVSYEGGDGNDLTLTVQ